jgi:hypothetical protein
MWFLEALDIFNTAKGVINWEESTSSFDAFLWLYKHTYKCKTAEKSKVTHELASLTILKVGGNSCYQEYPLKQDLQP